MTETATAARPSRLRTVLVLGRVSNLPTVWTNVLAGWFLAFGGWDWQIAWLAAAISALYIGGMTLNDAFDVKWDREHAPERPVPSGAISERGVWLLGIGWMVVGVVLALLATEASVVWVGVLVVAILLYDGIHKYWSGAMWLMGACRAMVYIVAGSVVAVDEVMERTQATGTGEMFRVMGGLSGPCGLALGAYVAGVTLIARRERLERRTGLGYLIGMVHLVLPIIVAGALLMDWPLFSQNPQPWWLSVSLLGFFGGLVFGLGRRRLSHSIGHGVVTLLAGIVVVDALFVSLVDWRAALVCLAFLPVVRWLQMRIPAT